MKKPLISIVLATHNRRSVVEHTLDHLDECGLDRTDYETVVVDNHSTDGTTEAIDHRVNRLIRLPRNAGSTAKAYGAEEARGQYIVFLDDDSYPHPGTLESLIHLFEGQGHLGAAGFIVKHANGESEGQALPGVFHACGVGLRAEAYAECGGLDRGFFQYGDEYDLSFRLADAGWDVGVFENLVVQHDRLEHASRPERRAYYFTRNHLRVLARWHPSPYAAIYRVDFLQMEEWRAARSGEECLRAFSRGRLAGDLRGMVERRTYHRNRLSEPAFERFYRWSEIRWKMTELWQSGANRLLFANLGRNIYPFHLAARQLGMDVVAIADDEFALPGRDYRGSPIVTTDDALKMNFDSIVVTTTGPEQAAETAALLTLKTKTPIHCWFGNRSLQSRQLTKALAPQLIAPPAMAGLGS